MDLFLGIDQSLNSPGFALVDERGEYVQSMTLSVTRDKSGVQREAYIRDGLRDFMGEHSEEVRAGAIEGYSVESTHRSFDLGGIFSVLRLFVFDETGKDLMIVPPMSLKKFITGNGHADKEMVLYSVKTEWEIDFEEDDNSADAFGLAKFAWAKTAGIYKRRCEAEAAYDFFKPKVKVKSRRKTVDV